VLTAPDVLTGIAVLPVAVTVTTIPDCPPPLFGACAMQAVQGTMPPSAKIALKTFGPILFDPHWDREVRKEGLRCRI
jgi:hypothetical protein